MVNKNEDKALQNKSNVLKLIFCLWSQNEPLYFVQVIEQVSAVQGTAEKDLTDPYGHFIGTSEKFLKG